MNNRNQWLAFVVLIMCAGCESSRLPLDAAGSDDRPAGTEPGDVQGRQALVAMFEQASGVGASRISLYEDSTFTGGPGSGTYSIRDSVVTFAIAALPQVASYKLSATLRGDTLKVFYSEMVGDIAPDVSYIRNNDHQNYPDQIHVAASDGSSTRRLAIGRRPAWSPDGRRIAYDRGGVVYLIDIDGSNLIRLVAGISPTWSPDGLRVAYTSAAGLSVINADGSGTATTLIRHDFREDTHRESDQGVGKASWSPDGKRIAFEHLGDGDMKPAQAYVMNADGSNPTLLTTAPNRIRYAESDPSWSPDGSQITFWSFGYGIAAVRAVGEEPISLCRDFPAIAYGTKPVLSVNGSLAFTRRGPSAGTSIWTIEPGGKTGQRIAGAFEPAWSPDGKRLAFVSGSPW